MVFLYLFLFGAVVCRVRDLFCANVFVYLSAADGSRGTDIFLKLFLPVVHPLNLFGVFNQQTCIMSTWIDFFFRKKLGLVQVNQILAFLLPLTQSLVLISFFFFISPMSPALPSPSADSF